MIVDTQMPASPAYWVAGAVDDDGKLIYLRPLGNDPVWFDPVWFTSSLDYAKAVRTFDAADGLIGVRHRDATSDSSPFKARDWFPDVQNRFLRLSWYPMLIETTAKWSAR